MRISDWSSDVCSSDLAGALADGDRVGCACRDHGIGTDGRAAVRVHPRVAADGGVVGTRGEAVAADSHGVLAAGRGAGADRHAARTVPHLRLTAATHRAFSLTPQIAKPYGREPGV